MKVSGFTFIRNAIKLDFPVVEAITSILPICDEVVVAVGNSEDDTLNMIKNISPKIRVIETTWDDNLREGGRVLAVETDKAFAEISADTDWCFYIQGDEVMHEKYLPVVKDAMQAHLNNPKVDGLLFHYQHFYGSYDYVGNALDWYPNEIRVVRNKKGIYSYRDAQGFRQNDNQKLNVKPIDAYIYHYGWVKEPKAMQRKSESFHRLWHDDEWMEKNIAKAEEFDYTQDLKSLHLFEGTHPEVMKERIQSKNWKFDVDISFSNELSLKNKAKIFLKKYLDLDFGYKNYKKI